MAILLISVNLSYQKTMMFGDNVLATAILDRLLHHSTTVNIKGEGYRLKEKRKTNAKQECWPKTQRQSVMMEWRKTVINLGVDSIAVRTGELMKASRRLPAVERSYRINDSRSAKVAGDSDSSRDSVSFPFWAEKNFSQIL